MNCTVSETVSTLLKRSFPSSTSPGWFRSALYQRDGLFRVISSPLCSRSQIKSQLHTATRSRCRILQTQTSNPRASFHSSTASFARQPQRRPDASVSKRTTAARGPRIFIPIIRQPELVRIFGCDVSETEGNAIIRTLHSRRLEGSLVDRGVQLDGETSVSPEGLMKALTWLRERYPVDEQSAAQMWAAKETARIQQTYITRAEKLGLYKPLEDADTAYQNRTDTSSSQYGQSALEEFKLYNERKKAEKEAKKVASGEAQQEQELALAKQVQREELQEQRREKRRAVIAARYEQGRVTQSTEIHQMTRTQRLLPSTLFAGLLLVSYYFLAELYTPPVAEERLFSSWPASVATTAGIFALNAIIFVCWKRSNLWKALNTWFTVSPSYPFALSMIGNVFSHRIIIHLAGNMAGMFLYGIPLHEDIGRGNWLALYLAGGVFGSICSLWFFVLIGKLNYYHNGASGAVCAVIAAWAYITASKPQKPTDSWDFVFDVTRWAALVFQVLSHFSKGVLARIDVPSHVGGAMVGLFGGWALKRQAEGRQLELEREEGESSGSSS